MACNLIDDQLVAFQLGEIDMVAGAGVERHLGECRACLAAYFTVKRGLEAAAKSDERPSPMIRRRLLAAMPTPRRRIAAGVVVAVACAAAVLAALWLWHPTRHGESPVTSVMAPIDSARPAASNLNTL
jgi:ferric-dicitrate binding protein FerR (iron transport regulator)